MQVKLLRSIQERRVRKVGSTTEEPVDVRILSATHQDLAKLVAAGALPAGPLLPPQRDRTARAQSARALGGHCHAGDVILDRLAQRAGAERVRLSPQALRELQSYPFRATSANWKTCSSAASRSRRIAN